MSDLKVGDLVRYVRAGCSVLDGGPGRVVQLNPGLAWVEVLTPCEPAGNNIRAGERFVFSPESLEKVSA